MDFVGGDNIVDSDSADLEILAAEPARLRSEARRATAGIKQLALDNYRVYISAGVCFSDTRNNVRAIGSDLDAISISLPQLASTCKVFHATARSIVANHRANQKTLQCHTQLLELLEIPQLMDTCIRNEMHKEALDLTRYANVLERRHTWDTSSNKRRDDANDVIETIISEVRLSTIALRSHLLGTLKQVLALQKIHKIVGLLKRLDQLMLQACSLAPDLASVVEKFDLPRDFLTCRDERIDREIEEILGDGIADAGCDDETNGEESDRQHRAIVVIIDRCRIAWFDIIMQYTALFNDDDTGPCSTASSEHHALIGNWVMGKVASFLDFLQASLQRVTKGTSIAEILQRSMSFALNMGRVGADFRHLLGPIFKSRLRGLVASQWERASVRFCDLLTPHMLKFCKNLPGPEARCGEKRRHIRQGLVPLPPSDFLGCPVLTESTNQYLSGFNELRNCALVSCRADLHNSLVVSLETMIQCLLDFRATHRTLLFKKESETVFSNLCAAVGTQLIPFIASCFAVVFRSHDDTDITRRLQGKLKDYGLLLAEDVATGTKEVAADEILTRDTEDNPTTQLPQVISREQLKDTSESDWQRIFDEADLDGDGVLGWDDVQKIVQKHYRLLPYQIEKALQRIDFNGDGQVSFDEFLKSCTKQTPALIIQDKTVIEAAVRHRFDEYDKDGNGTLDRAELAAFLTNFSITQECNRVTAILDKDGDDRVTRKEFLAAVTKAGGILTLNTHLLDKSKAMGTN